MASSSVVSGIGTELNTLWAVKEKMKLKTKLKRKTRPTFDWREGVCQFCGIEAVNGCCDRHEMECPLCCGYGAVSKGLWDKFYGKRWGTHTANMPIHREELKEWICGELDSLEKYGCESCWSDSGGCTCKKDKQKMKEELLKEFAKRLNENCD